MPISDYITHTISIIEFTDGGRQFKIIYFGPIHAANAVISGLSYAVAVGSKKGTTKAVEYDLTKGEYQIIDILTGNVIEESRTVTREQFELLLQRNKAT